MFFVYFGKESGPVREKSFAFLHTITEPDTLVTRVTADTYQEGVVADLTESVSLFEAPQVIVLDTLSEHETAFAEVLDTLSALQKSTNTFVLIEGALSAPHKKRIEACAEKIHEVNGKIPEKFNIFSLCDALLERNKKSLWLLLMEAWKNGSTNEEIIGTLMWQMKILRLAERTKTAEEAGQKTYPYDKAKRALTRFKKGEVDALARSLLVIYHEGHTGKRDLTLALEEWVLQM